MLELVLQTPGALPPLVWGTFGTAKTSIVRAIAKALGWHCETVIASTRQPEDFGGIGVPDETHGLRRLPDAWVNRVQRAAEKFPRVVVFFSEISCTPPATQSSLLRGIHEGVWGDIALDPAKVGYCADANPPDEAAGGWDLALPLANRFTHIQWETPTLDQWQAWIMGNPDAIGRFTVLDVDRWNECYGTARAHVCGFLKRFSEYLTEDVKKDVGRFPAAYARPRTWENAARLLATIYATGREDAKLAILAASVGAPAATKFATWLEEADLPDPEDVLKDPESWTPNARREDVIFAVLNSVSAAALRPLPDAKVRTERWHAAWRVLERAIPYGKDLAVIAGRTLAFPDNRPKNALANERTLKVIRSIIDVLKDSGLYET